MASGKPVRPSQQAVKIPVRDSEVQLCLDISHAHPTGIKGRNLVVSVQLRRRVSLRRELSQKGTVLEKPLSAS